MKKIAVDLDGTLAHYKDGQYPEIGEPVEAMLTRVTNWLDDGHEVIIFTARASIDGRNDIEQIEHWLKKHGIGGLEITCIKTTDIDEFWDDKAVQVIPNTGQCIGNERLQESYATQLDMKSARRTNMFHELEKDRSRK
jgi:hydroxymethylpyrimidine pyrophosphatase-like HAD family hydrolase